MTSKWIAVGIATALFACKSKPPPKPAPAPAPHAASTRGRAPLPGTEAMQNLLSGVGHSAAPAAGTAARLGGLFGAGGVLGGGPSLGLGVTSTAPGGVPIGPRSAPSVAKPIDVGDTRAAGTDDPDGTYRNGGGDPYDDTADPGAPADTGAAPEPPPPVNVTLPPPLAAGGDCHAVALRVGDLARAMMDAQLATVDADTRAMAESMVSETIAAVPTMIEGACAAQAWPQELRDCILTGRDLDALQSCERFATPAMKAAAAAPPVAPTPSTPPPTWDGASTDCAATAAHAAALAEWQLSAAPPDIRATGTDLLAQITSGVESACTAGAWPEPLRRCILTATSIDAMNTCAP